MTENSRYLSIDGMQGMKWLEIKYVPGKSASESRIFQGWRIVPTWNFQAYKTMEPCSSLQKNLELGLCLLLEVTDFRFLYLFFCPVLNHCYTGKMGAEKLIIVLHLQLQTGTLLKMLFQRITSFHGIISLEPRAVYFQPSSVTNQQAISISRIVFCLSGYKAPNARLPIYGDVSL